MASPTSPPGLDVVRLDLLETSLLIVQQLAVIRQQLSRTTDGDEQYALQVMADDYTSYLQDYEDFEDRSFLVEELVEANQGSDAPSIENVECIACTESVPLSMTLPTPCGHHFCQPCFETLVHTAITNETFFPPWCCSRSRRIDIEQITSVPSSGEGILTINDDLRFQLREKSREYAVPPPERTYCPNPRCSVFLGSIIELRSEAEGRRRRLFWLSRLRPFRPTSTCSSCATSFCLECKGRAHSRKECEIKLLDEGLRKLAEKQKWQICCGCKELVQRTSGCDHMVCLCKTEFCYSCGELWTGPCACRS